jgi:hypothetical protein
MHQVFVELMTVENITARAFHVGAAGLARFSLVRRQAFAGIPKRIFPSRPIPRIVPCLEISLSSPWATPFGARRFEVYRAAIGVLARDANLGKSRSSNRIDLRPPARPRGLRSCRRARRRKDVPVFIAVFR